VKIDKSPKLKVQSSKEAPGFKIQNYCSLTTRMLARLRFPRRRVFNVELGTFFEPGVLSFELRSAPSATLHLAPP
jgi:hypothetical protein